uniref:Uncharacterized protein n=1 Tax=Ditylenchus dipsaci TaxID=166011 RepID=A0A915D9T1_9BILA
MVSTGPEHSGGHQPIRVVFTPFSEFLGVPISRLSLFHTTKMSEIDESKEEKHELHVKEEQHKPGPQKSIFLVFIVNFFGVVIYLAILYAFLAAICFPLVYYLPLLYKVPEYSFLNITSAVEQAIKANVPFSAPQKTPIFLSTQLDEPTVEVKIASTKPFADKPSGKTEEEESVHSFSTELYDIPLIDKSTNSVEQAFPNHWEENSSRLNKEPGLQSKRFIRVSERLGRIRKRRPADIYRVGPRRHKKRKVAVESNLQPSDASAAAVTMTPLSELEIKSDLDLQKSLHRTTMRTVNYGPVERPDATTPVSVIGHQHSSSAFSTHPHVPPLAHNMPALAAAAPTFTLLAQPGSGPPPALAVNGQNSNNINKTEQYEQLGCGFDLMTQSCKDVFGVSICNT